MTITLAVIMAVAFIAGSVVSWRITWRRGTTNHATLARTALGGFAGFLTSIVVVFGLLVFAQLAGVSLR